MSFIMCLAIFVSMLAQSSASTVPTATVIVGMPSAQNTVDVEISLSNNPGIITMILEVNYNPDVMTLIKVTDAGVLGTAMHTDNLSLHPYQLTWNNGTAPTDFKSNGKIVTLTFQITNGSTEGSYPVTLKASGTMNYNLNDISFVTVSDNLVLGGSQSTTKITGNVAIAGTVATPSITVTNLPVGYNATILVAQYYGEQMVSVRVKHISKSDKYELSGFAHTDGALYRIFLLTQGSLEPLCEDTNAAYLKE